MFLKGFLVVNQHWLRKWPGAFYAPGPFLNQCFTLLSTYPCDFRFRPLFDDAFSFAFAFRTHFSFRMVQKYLNSESIYV